jgi:hypothetical protein
MSETLVLCQHGEVLAFIVLLLYVRDARSVPGRRVVGVYFITTRCLFVIYLFTFYSYYFLVLCQRGEVLAFIWKSTHVVSRELTFQIR